MRGYLQAPRRYESGLCVRLVEQVMKRVRTVARDCRYAAEQLADMAAALLARRGLAYAPIRVLTEEARQEVARQQGNNYRWF